MGQGAALRKADAILSQIKFPLDFQRGIPSLDSLKTFKASEFKNLLLYGLIPSVKDLLLRRAELLPEAGDFLHWTILYHEIAVRLNSDSILIESLEFVERLIDTWQRLLPIFLGYDSQSYNAHALAHLPHYVRQLGPVHNFSTFAFESFNYTYAQMVTSAHGTIIQVARRFLHEKYMENWLHLVTNSSNTKLSETVNSIFKKRFRTNCVFEYGNVKLLAEPEVSPLPELECLAVRSFFPNIGKNEVLTARQVKVGSLIVASEVSETGSNKCTHIAKFRNGNTFFYAIIVRIIIIDDEVYGVCKKFVVVRNLMDDLPSPSHVVLQSLWNNDFLPYGNFFHFVELLPDFYVMPLQRICRRCLVVNTDRGNILIEECMRYEHN